MAEPLIGIELVVCVQRADETPLDSDEFWGKFIDFIEANGWLCGGSSRSVDLNADEEYELPTVSEELHQTQPTYQARHRKDPTHEE